MKLDLLTQPMLKIYAATAMSGRSGFQLREEAKERTILAAIYGVSFLDPVLVEGVEPTEVPLNNPMKQLRLHWKRDKQMIREAHVLIDTTGPMKSEGVTAELGFARWFLFKPTIRVWPGLGPSVARIEGDLICNSLEDAVFMAKRLWGTRTKRLAWRFSLFLRCFPKYVWTRFNNLWDWI